MDYDEILLLLTALRSSNPNDIQNADNQLEQLCHSQQTIYKLFHLLDRMNDKTLNKYVLFLLLNCFRNCGQFLSESDHLTCRQMVLNYLQNEDNAECIMAVAKLIELMIQMYDAEWNELNAFIENCQNLFCALTFSTLILNSVSPEHLHAKLEFFCHLVYSGLNSDDPYICLQAIEFFNALYKVVQDKTNYDIPNCTQFETPILNLFFRSIYKMPHLSTGKILSAILQGMCNDIKIFPFLSAFPKIINSFYQQTIENEAKRFLHYFLMISLAKLSPQDFYTEEIIKILVNLEKYMVTIAFSQNEPFLVVESLNDIFKAIKIYFSNVEPQDGSKFLLSNANNLVATNNFDDACFALILTKAAAVMYYNIMNNNEIMFIIFLLIQSMESNNQILQNFGITFFDDASDFLRKNICQDNKILEKAFSAFKCVMLNLNDNGEYLLKFVSILKNCDPILNDLLIITHNIIDMMPEFYYGYLSLTEIIKCSNSIVFNNFQYFYSYIKKKIYSPLFYQCPNYYVLTPLKQLILLYHEQIYEYLDEFLPILFEYARQTKDQILKQQILMVFLAVVNSFEKTNSFLYNCFPFFMTMSNKNWREKFVKADSNSVKLERLSEKFDNAVNSMLIIVKTFDKSKYYDFYAILPIIYSFFLPIENYPFLINSPLTQIIETIIINIPNFKTDQNFPNIRKILSDIFKISFKAFKMCIYNQLDDDNLMITLSELIQLIYIFAKYDYIPSEVFLHVLDFFSDVILLAIDTDFFLIKGDEEIDFLARIYGICSASVPLEQTTNNLLKIIEKSEASNYNSTKIFTLQLLGSFPFNIFPILNSSSLQFYWNKIIDIIKMSNTLLSAPAAEMIMNLFRTISMEEKNAYIPLALDIVHILKELLEGEINNDSNLRDIHAILLSYLGANFIGDLFPFEEVVPLILQSTPILHETKHCEYVYNFLTSVEKRFFNNEMRMTFCVKLIQLFARPINEIFDMNIDMFILSSLESFLNHIIENEDIIKQALENDQNKMNLFIETYSRLKIDLSFFIAQFAQNYINA